VIRPWDATSGSDHIRQLPPNPCGVGHAIV
jgi:hypothetical protein